MRLLFQQSCCLWWLLMAQTKYRNMGKGCEGILPQGKGLHNSRMLRKLVAIYKTHKLILSKKSLKKVQKKERGSEKLPYPKSSCSKLIFFNQPITYSMFTPSLWAIIITGERTHTITVRSCCRTHLTLFISELSRSLRPCCFL